MIYTTSLSFLYTPLEQFDNVRWLSHEVLDTFAPLTLFALEGERTPWERYTTSLTETSSFSDRRFSEHRGLFIVVAILAVFLRFPALLNYFALATGNFSV